MNFSLSTEVATSLFILVPVIVIASAAVLTAVQQRLQKN